ncbi:MAG: cupin domain-containing protein [Porticoccaceae bacterium]|nr:cupin domain-containing protein [Pseudomonadales bacterium]MCP5171625.1 cupin domain-containing protein [Pseudomonadales bacterium]
MSKQTILGEISAQQFLAEYWQQKPLLIRNALPDFESPLSPDDLAGLALDDDIESRIILEQGPSSSWELLCGPFEEQIFHELPKDKWTLLVQAVDLWVPEVKQLLEHFSFLPPWRLDDIMVSYAPEGGSVGPHFDYYDVFLIQGYGQRRWQIGGHSEQQKCNEESPRVGGTPLRILDNFDPLEDWLLNPGDILYLPPQVAHHGVAVGESMTYSVGFRAPTAAEMLGDLATELLARPNSPHYQDPVLTPGMASEMISPEFIGQARKLLNNILEDDALLADWFARYMTTPKYPELVEETDERRVARTQLRKYVNGDIVT